MNKIILLLIFAFEFGGANTCYGQNYFEEGKSEYFKGNNVNAILLFTKAIGSNQEISKSYMLRGAAKSMVKDFGGCFFDLSFSMSLDSNNFKAYFYYGRAYFFEGRNDSAIYFYNIAISKNNSDAVSYDYRALSKLSLQDYIGGINDEDAAIKLDSTDESYFTNRGFGKMQLGRYLEAITDFSKSLNISPSQKAYANRGLSYSLIGQNLKAISDFTSSLNIYPNDYEVLYHRGQSYLDLGDKPKACLDIRASASMGYSPAKSALANNCTN